jgi:hypothetical protein
VWLCSPCFDPPKHVPTNRCYLSRFYSIPSGDLSQLRKETSTLAAKFCARRRVEVGCLRVRRRHNVLYSIFPDYTGCNIRHPNQDPRLHWTKIVARDILSVVKSYKSPAIDSRRTLQPTILIDLRYARGLLIQSNKYLPNAHKVTRPDQTPCGDNVAWER